MAAQDPSRDPSPTAARPRAQSSASPGHVTDSRQLRAGHLETLHLAILCPAILHHLNGFCDSSLLVGLFVGLLLLRRTCRTHHGRLSVSEREDEKHATATGAVALMGTESHFDVQKAVLIDF
ncbi:hypothetical protein GGX14DRAFT_573179 [Mycena pura]|uniref:Uncharacterized protein n=1 Tax=Mycena pura TaxID=153505 RepID=A0AAD6Y309_9AGAR|nr:hypothetical protein GGX14DRAFT_573179 [Mycena pura]